MTYLMLYNELTDQYRFTVRMKCAKPRLYPTIEAEKPDSQPPRVSGYRKSDRSFIDNFVTYENVPGELEAGFFADLYPKVSAYFDQMVESEEWPRRFARMRRRA
jgi:hypothetical protein